MNKIIYILTFLLLVTVGYSVINEDHPQVYMVPHVDQYLSEISTNYPLETLACLDYIEFDDNVYVYDYNIARTNYATKTKVSGEVCEDDQAPYHNHPYQDLHNERLQEYYTETTGDTLTSAKQMLYMSGPDIRYSLWYKFDHVFVGSNGEYAWWKEDQIRKAYRNGKRILLVIGKQSSLLQ